MMIMKNLKLLSLATVMLAVFSVLATSGLGDAITVNAGVSSSMSAVFNYTTVEFGSLSQGSSNNHPSGTYKVDVTTNSPYTVSASGTDFSGSGHTFAVGNMTFGANATLGNVYTNMVVLTANPQVVSSFANSVTTNYHGYSLNVPADQFATSYASTVTVTYAN
jgi:hypothetical protein